jgi:hypothetical protein
MHIPQDAHEDTHDTPLDAAHLALAYVDDAHNLGCTVRVFGEEARRRARYSTAIQEGGVVIRACHLVAVDLSHGPLEVVWRVGTRGTVERLEGDQVTLDLGYRRLTIPVRDERPEEERRTPLAVGDSVLLQGSPVEEARIMDVLVNGELAHPERLQAHVLRAIERRAQR